MPEHATVLLVDDNETYIRTKKRFLERAGHIVYLATSVGAAKAIIDSLADLITSI